MQIDSAGGVEGVFVEVVTGDSFPTIAVEALLGRVIGPADDVAPGGHPAGRACAVTVLDTLSAASGR